MRPGDVGLPPAGPRRVPGLRRDELARLAGISPDYYTRIEQGRFRPSPHVLAALARVLVLDAVERQHLLLVAGGSGRALPAEPDDAVNDATHDLLRRLADLPALVVGPALDALAWTPVCGLLLGLDRTGERNMARRTFLLPESRLLYPEWESVAAEAVAHLRRLSAGRDPRIDRLVGSLSAGSAEFTRLWGRHDVRSGIARRKAFHHPRVGRFELEPEVLTLTATGQTLCLYRAAAGTPGADALVLLNALLTDAGPVRAPRGGRRPGAGSTDRAGHGAVSG